MYSSFHPHAQATVLLKRKLFATVCTVFTWLHLAYSPNGPNNSGAMDVSTCASDVAQMETPEVFPKEGGHHKKEKGVQRLKQFKVPSESFLSV